MIEETDVLSTQEDAAELPIEYVSEGSYAMPGVCSMHCNDAWAVCEDMRIIGEGGFE